MSKTRNIKLRLRSAIFDGVNGEGNDLSFVFRASRRTKAGTDEFYNITVEGCRGTVRRILEELRKMHERDRERLKREQDRIAIEANVLVRQ